MARIRTIKPSYWSDAKVCRLSIEAQLLFVGLWCFADCDGLMWDDPDQIQMDVFPSRPHIDVPRCLEELLLSGMVVPLETTAARRVLWIKNFSLHQRIHNEAKSDIAPSLSDPHVLIGRAPEESGENPTERKGKEGKGRERKGTPSVASPDWAPSEQAQSWARQNHPSVDVDAETERFLNWVAANGKRFVDWNAAWRNWITKAEEYNHTTNSRGPHRSTNLEVRDTLLRKHREAQA